MSDNPYEVFNHITVAYDTCALCGRALTVAAGEPVVCSDCERETARIGEEIMRDREEEYDLEAYDPLDDRCEYCGLPYDECDCDDAIDEPGSSSSEEGGGR